MPDVQAFLTKKAGPLPVWGWAALGGGLVSVLYLRGKGQATAPAPGQPGADGATTGYYSPSPIVVTTGSMPDSTSSANPATPVTSSPPPAPVWQFGTGFMALPRGKVVWHVTQGASIPGFPGGQVYPLTSSDPSRVAPNAPANSWQWAAVPDGTDPSGQPWTDQSYAQALGAAGMGGGGGASSVIKTLPGAGRVGRFSSRHAHPQYLSTGMGGGGRGALRAVSERTKLPEVRLMALNPGHWQPRPGGVPRHIHIR